MTTTTSDAELFRRGMRTLVASGEANALGAADAAVHHLDGVVAAVFPSGPERDVYNNAVLGQGLSKAGRAEAIEAMESHYHRAGVDRFAAWVCEDDTWMREDLERRGYIVSETTRAMGLDLDRLVSPRPRVDAAPPAWSDYQRLFLPDRLLAGLDPATGRLATGPPSLSSKEADLQGAVSPRCVRWCSCGS